MFNKTRIERIFKYLVEDEQHIEQHHIEIMRLKAKVEELEEACVGYAEAFKILADSDKKLVAVLDDCETRINQLENDRAEMKKRIRELEEKHCCNECGKCDGACQE